MPFYAAVAVAGLAFSALDLLDRRIPHLGRILPTPLIAGYLVALGLLVLDLLGHPLHVPDSGNSVDFLVGVLTANMGLHVTPKVLRRGAPLFLLFLACGIGLFWIQLAVALPFTLGEPHALARALLNGPVSFLGAPYNLNPPNQVEPIAAFLAPAAADPVSAARGIMMIGVIAGPVLASLMLDRLSRRVRHAPGDEPAEEQPTPTLPIDRFGEDEMRLLALMFALVAAAFGIQKLVHAAFPAVGQDQLPVIVISYLLGALTRLSFERVFGCGRFPEASLTALLLGPTMGFVLTYAVMSIPLELLFHVAPLALAAGAAVVAVTAGVSILLFRLFRRFAHDDFYAAIIATAFLAVTTAWGPVAMSFLRRVTEVKGRVEPMPAILPLNAFYLFPWTVILLVTLVARGLAI